MTVVLLGILSAISNGLYGHFYEPLVRKNDSKGIGALVPPILLYFLAGTAITTIGILGAFFVPSWHVKSITAYQLPFFALMVAGYATHIVTEAVSRQRLDMTVYNVFFQSQTIFLVLINVLIGKASATWITWTCVLIIVGAGVTTVSNKETWKHTNSFVILALSSALARAIAFTIDGVLAPQVFNWWIYEGFTFLLPSLTVFAVGALIAWRRIGPAVLVRRCSSVLDRDKKGFGLASSCSGLEFLFGVASMNLAMNKALPSALQGIVPIISLIVELIFHPHRIKPRIVIGALLASAALVTIAMIG